MGHIAMMDSGHWNKKSSYKQKNHINICLIWLSFQVIAVLFFNSIKIVEITGSA